MLKLMISKPMNQIQCFLLKSTEPRFQIAASIMGTAKARRDEIGWEFHGPTWEIEVRDTEGKFACFLSANAIEKQPGFQR